MSTSTSTSTSTTRAVGRLARGATKEQAKTRPSNYLVLVDRRGARLSSINHATLAAAPNKLIAVKRAIAIHHPLKLLVRRLKVPKAVHPAKKIRDPSGCAFRDSSSLRKLPSSRPRNSIRTPALSMPHRTSTPPWLS